MTIEERIRKTELFMGGEKFYTAQMASYLKVHPRQANTALQTMLERREIIVVSKTTRGTSYRRSMENPVIRAPWRKRSLEQLGLEPVDCILGVQV